MVLINSELFGWLYSCSATHDIQRLRSRQNNRCFKRNDYNFDTEEGVVLSQSRTSREFYRIQKKTTYLYNQTRERCWGHHGQVAAVKIWHLPLPHGIALNQYRTPPFVSHPRFLSLFLFLFLFLLHFYSWMFFPRYWFIVCYVLPWFLASPSWSPARRRVPLLYSAISFCKVNCLVLIPLSVSLLSLPLLS